MKMYDVDEKPSKPMPKLIFDPTKGPLHGTEKKEQNLKKEAESKPKPIVDAKGKEEQNNVHTVDAIKK
jgi:hypothetical protein